MRRNSAGPKRGRPKGTHTLTPDRAHRVEAAIRAGNHINTACALAGVGTSTFYRWMHRAERVEYAIAYGQPHDPGDDVYRDFRDSVLRARAEAAEMMVNVVMRAAVGGQLVAEEAALDGAGNPIRDVDGRVIMKRKWTIPDGRLALAYLKVAQPDGWAGAPTRLEASGPGSGPIPGGDGEPDADSISRLASWVSAAVERQKQQAEREAYEAARALDAAAEPDDVHEAGLVEDDS